MWLVVLRPPGQGIPAYRRAMPKSNSIAADAASSAGAATTRQRDTKDASDSNDARPPGPSALHGALEDLPDDVVPHLDQLHRSSFAVGGHAADRERIRHRP